jgi:inositol phosphorylceramide mannosyltransferase catalytic subunit
MPLMSDDYNFEHNIPNAWFGSVPGHPFWVHLLENMQREARTSMSNDNAEVESATGPIQLMNSLKSYEVKPGTEKSRSQIRYVAPGLIFPYDWHDAEGKWDTCSAQSAVFNSTKCKLMFGDEPYSITYWSHSWGDENSLKNLYHD